MKIRSICVGMDASWPLVVEDVQGAGRFLRSARARFEDAGREVQTTRLALSPFAELRPGADPDWVVPMAREVEAACRAEGIEFISIGPVRWSRLESSRAIAYAAILPDAIGASEQVSASVETAANGRLYASAARAAGEAIARLARETPLGFGNFRFCAIAEGGPNIPFFPSAYHAGGPPRFTIGLEAADDVRRAFVGAGDLGTLERRLGETLGTSVQRVEALAHALADETGVVYGGTDLTPAPFPSDDISSAGMLEDLGAGVFGGAGTLTAASLLTGMLKRLPFQHVGFSGLMLPVLEDSVLAARTGDGHLTWQELLLYSAVCGTGLDTVPLPGDAAPAELAAIALDVATLAVTLHKPLSCRLFPVPGKAAGDLTEYDFPYFANARVLALPGRGSDRLLDRFDG